MNVRHIFIYSNYELNFFPTVVYVQTREKTHSVAKVCLSGWYNPKPFSFPFFLFYLFFFFFFFFLVFSIYRHFETYVHGDVMITGSVFEPTATSRSSSRWREMFVFSADGLKLAAIWHIDRVINTNQFWKAYRNEHFRKCSLMLWNKTLPDLIASVYDAAVAILFSDLSDCQSKVAAWSKNRRQIYALQFLLRDFYICLFKSGSLSWGSL